MTTVQEMFGSGELCRGSAPYFYEMCYAYIAGKMVEDYTLQMIAPYSDKVANILRRRQRTNELKCIIACDEFVKQSYAFPTIEAAQFTLNADLPEAVMCGMSLFEITFPNTWFSALKEFMVLIRDSDDGRELLADGKIRLCSHQQHVRRDKRMDERYPDDFKRLTGFCGPRANEELLQTRPASKCINVECSKREDDCVFSVYRRKWCPEEAAGITVRGIEEELLEESAETEWDDQDVEEYPATATVKVKGGNSMSCVSGDCDCVLLLLRRYATHFSSVSDMWENFDDIIRYDSMLLEVDEVIGNGDLQSLRATYERATEKLKETNATLGNFCDGLDFGCEKELGHWVPWVKYWKEVERKPTNVCLSCSIQFYRDRGVLCRWSKDTNDDIGLQCCSTGKRGKVWNNAAIVELRDYHSVTSLSCDKDENVFICKRCWDNLKRESRSSLSMLNGLQVDEGSEVLNSLNQFEKQLISLAKCFQTITRLRPIKSKVPPGDCIRSLKGSFVCLPLPLSRTFETVRENFLSFPSDDMHLLVNGRPTTSRTIWQHVVNWKKVERSLQELKATNHLYKNINFRNVLEDLPVSTEVDVEEDEIVGLCREVIEDPSISGVQGASREMNTVIDSNRKEGQGSNQNSVLLDVVRDAVTSDPSMLSKLSEEEEQALLSTYTVHSLFNQGERVQELEHYKVESILNKFLDHRANDLDIYCFPVLYPCGRYGRGQGRDITLSNPDFIKSRLYNSNPKFRRDQQYLFFLLHDYRRRAISGGVLQMLRNTLEYRDITAERFVQMIQAKDQRLENNMTNLLGAVRGTAEYWSRKRANLRAMVNAKGVPTFFVTFSAAEYAWDDMRALLIAVNQDNPWIEGMRNGERCSFDPVYTCFHFHRRFEAFFQNIILSKDNPPLGEITDYFYRIEYQARGAPHYHMLLWVKDAPVIGVHSEKVVLDFIQRHITCRLPSREEEPVLFDLVNRFQQHSCNPYCKRTRTVNRVRVTRCRFDFPRCPRDVGLIRDPIESAKGKAKGKKGCRLYELARTEKEIRINDYNPRLLLAWRENMDVQFVGDSKEAILEYVMSYITKKVRSDLQQLWEEVGNDSSLPKQLFRFACRALSSRECGIYEAVDIITGQRLYRMSQPVKYICGREAKYRSKLLKTYKRIREISEVSPMSRDLYELNWITDYYPNRPNAMEEMSLYDFMKWYVKASKKDVEAAKKRQCAQEQCVPAISDEVVIGEEQGNDSDQENNEDAETVSNPTVVQLRNEAMGFIKKRTKPFVVSHQLLDVRRYPDEYWYALLLMFKPFRDECLQLHPAGIVRKDLFERELEMNEQLRMYHERLEEQYIRDEERRAAFEMEESEQQEGLEEPEMFGAADDVARAMNEMEQLDQTAQVGKLDCYLRDMSSEQLSVFKLLTRAVLGEYVNQVVMFISGSGGTGKSFVINGWRAWKNETDKAKDNFIVVIAPTGIAAFNVSGMTVHRMFHLPIETVFEPLNDAMLGELRNAVLNLQLIIVDEVSMVSNLVLAYVHLRLCQITKKHDLAFGGVHIVFLGDFMQLKPVGNPSVFVPISNEVITSRIGSLWGADLWKTSITHYEEFTKSMRQQDDPEFGALLDRLRFGRLTRMDLKTLESRKIHATATDPSSLLNAFANYYSELRKMGQSVVCLMANVSTVDEFNDKLLEKEQSDIKVIEARDDFVCLGRVGKKQVSTLKDMLKKKGTKIGDTAGLEATLKICVGARVMLRRNVDVAKGLVNGTVGTVVKIDVKNLENDLIWVKFDNVNHDCGVGLVMGKFPLVKNVRVTRIQFPLVLAYAMTIHKCQGLTLENVIVDAGNTIFDEGMVYVAFSRVKRLQGLHLINFDPSKAVAYKDGIKEMNRLRRLHKPHLDPIPLDSTKYPSVPDRVWYTKKAVNSGKSKTTTERTKRAHESSSVPSVTKKIPGESKTTRKRRKGSNESSSVPSVAKKRRTDFRWAKLGNKGTACYSNVAMHGLFALFKFRSICMVFDGSVDKLKRALFDFYAKYEQSKQAAVRLFFTVHVRNALCAQLREVVGQQFEDEGGQHDPLEFIDYLLIALSKEDMFNFTYKTRRKCFNSNCGYMTTGNIQILSTLQVFLRDGPDFRRMLQAWSLMADMVCPTCGTSNTIKETEKIELVQRQVMVRINRYFGGVRNEFDNRPVANFDPDRVILGEGFVMKAVAIIYHYGTGASNMHTSDIVYGISPKTGHYKANIRTNEYGWIHCDDSKVEKLPIVPLDLRNAVALILEYVETEINVNI